MLAGSVIIFMVIMSSIMYMSELDDEGKPSGSFNDIPVTTMPLPVFPLLSYNLRIRLSVRTSRTLSGAPSSP